MTEGNIVPPQWQFQPEEQQAAQGAAADDSQHMAGVQWTASEFLAHHKDGSWYLLLGLAAVVVAGGIYLLTRDVISAVMALVVGALLGVLAARKPRTLTYIVSQDGVQIGDKFYPVANFKAFSVINEGAVNSIMLVPLKRFSPAVNMYYAPEDEGRILDALSMVLPYEERKQDPLDKFMQNIRF